MSWPLAIATLGAGFLGYKGQKEANEQTREMSDTAHQREVADLRLAGLNPILSAGGPGASTAQMQNPLASAADAVRSLPLHKLQEQQMNTAKAGEILTDAKAQGMRIDNLKGEAQLLGLRAMGRLVPDALKGSAEYKTLDKKINSLIREDVSNSAKSIVDYNYGRDQRRPKVVEIGPGELMDYDGDSKWFYGN